jgi:prophage regulatory protein
MKLRTNQKTYSQPATTVITSEPAVTAAAGSAVATSPSPQVPSQRQLLRESEVCGRTRKHRSSVWRDVRSGAMPSPVRLGPNSIAWYADEIDAWVANRPRVRGTTESE